MTNLTKTLLFTLSLFALALVPAPTSVADTSDDIVISVEGAEPLVIPQLTQDMFTRSKDDIKTNGREVWSGDKEGGVSTDGRNIWSGGLGVTEVEGIRTVLTI